MKIWFVLYIPFSLGYKVVEVLSFASLFIAWVAVCSKLQV